MRIISILLLFTAFIAARAHTKTCKTIQHQFPEGANGDATRAEAVKAAYVRSWNEYAAVCFGRDDLLPISHGCRDDLSGFGVTIIDAMDTSILMGLTNIVARQLEHAATVDFSNSTSLVELFDMTIRYIAGLLSAHDMLTSGLFPNPYNQEHVDALVTQAATLATNLKPCFDTPTGLPATYVNYTTKQPVAGFPVTVGNITYPDVTVTAQAGTLILEWYRLADKTGDMFFQDLAKRAESFILEPNPPPKLPYLVGTALNTNMGQFVTFDGGWKSGVDSFLEYLVKTHIYDPKKDTDHEWKKFWVAAANSTVENIALHPYGHPELTFLSELDNDGNIMWAMDDYACFARGNLMLGGNSLTGLGPLTFAWYNASNLAYDPQHNNNATYRTYASEHGHFVIRPQYNSFPETSESIFYGWRITGDPKWQDYNWQIFISVNTTRAESTPYWEITNINEPYGGEGYDYLSSYYFAETLKYLYLTFTEPGVVGLERWTFNTEAHPMLIQRGTCEVEEARKKGEL